MCSIRNILVKLQLPDIETIAVAGSIGRMEASPDVSDADLIVVLREGIDLESDQATDIYESVWEALAPLKIPKPKLTGVFARPTSKSQLESSIGKSDEKLDVFGKRLLMLLESQPVFNDKGYEDLIEYIVRRYARKYVAHDSKKEWTLLLNDLIRYFRSLAVNYQWDFDNETEKWAIRNVKLRHSRLVMYSGLLFLLGEASKQRDNKVDWLLQRLKMTPLERMAWVYEQNEDWNFYRVTGLYNTFLFYLNQPEVRKKLNFNPEELSSEQDLDSSYEQRYDVPEFALLKANSDALVAELCRFIFSCRSSWTERFFEYLLF
jgi:predicted nucleotidyltransferase